MPSARWDRVDGPCGRRTSIPARRPTASATWVLHSSTASWSTRFDPPSGCTRRWAAAAAAEAAEHPFGCLVGARVEASPHRLDILASVAALGEPGEAEPRVIRVADFARCGSRRASFDRRSKARCLITGSNLYQGSASPLRWWCCLG